MTDETQERFYSVFQVSRILNCSDKHVRRLADSGRMPRPVKLGHLLRWDISVLEQWITDGCPKVSPTKRGRQ